MLAGQSVTRPVIACAPSSRMLSSKRSTVRIFPHQIQSALVDQAEGNGIFSEARADMIAATEISRAQVSGNYKVWKQSGVVLKLKWLISADHDEEDECDLNEDVEVKFGELFPSGNLHPPLHPHCKCARAGV